MTNPRQALEEASSVPTRIAEAAANAVEPTEAAARIQALETERIGLLQANLEANTQLARVTLKKRNLETSLAEARRQALEEAAKIADTIMRGEVTGLKLDSSYRAGIRWAGERIKDAIRALASDEAKK